jgi:zinc/manganese transport system permease protein
MIPPIVQILGLPFLACILISSILGYMGTHVLKREIIFIDIALAQIAAVGAVAAHMIFEVHGDSLLAYSCSFCCVLLTAGFYAFVRSKIIQISLEAVIGISYAIAAAAVLFLVGIVPGGHTHIQSILSGSLLWTDWKHIIISVGVFSTVGGCFYLIRKPIAEISNNYQKTTFTGSKIIFWDFIFYVLLGLVITLAVQIGGIIIVFAYLIIPATISAVLTSGLALQMVVIWTASVFASLCGLLFAYYFDFSVGPSIALFLGGELIIISGLVRFLPKISRAYKRHVE